MFSKKVNTLVFGILCLTAFNGAFAADPDPTPATEEKKEDKKDGPGIFSQAQNLVCNKSFAAGAVVATAAIFGYKAWQDQNADTSEDTPAT